MPDKCRVIDGINMYGETQYFSFVKWKGEEDKRTISVLMEASKLSYARHVFDMLRDAGTLTVDYQKFEKTFKIALKRKKKENFQICKQPGWYDEELVTSRQTYSISSEIIMYHVSRLEGGIRSAFKGASYSELKKAIAELGQHSDLALFAFFAGYAGIARNVAGVKEGVAFYFCGESSTGKTSLLNIAESVYPENMKSDVENMDFTERAVDELLAKFNDQTVCLDEFGQYIKADRDKAVSLAFKIGNGRGKSVSGSKKVQAEYPNLSWRVIAIIAGEQDVGSYIDKEKLSGAAARLIQINIPPQKEGGIFADNEDKNLPAFKERKRLLKKFQSASSLHDGWAFSKFAKKLVTDLPGAREFLKLTLEGFREEVSENADPYDHRIIEKFALVAATGELLVKYGLIPLPEGEAFNAIARVYENWKKSNRNCKVNERDIVRDACLRIAALLYNRKKFSRVQKGKSKALDYHADCLGIVRVEKGAAIVCIRKEKLPYVLDSDEPAKIVKALRNVHGLVVSAKTRESCYSQTQITDSNNQEIKLSTLRLSKKTLLKEAIKCDLDLLPS